MRCKEAIKRNSSQSVCGGAGVCVGVVEAVRVVHAHATTHEALNASASDRNCPSSVGKLNFQEP